MEFKNTQSYKCFRSICLWSLLSDLIVILSFCTSLAYAYVNEDWGRVGWIVPLLVKLFFVFCFAVAIGYFSYVLYMEYEKEVSDLSLTLINKTEEIFNKIIRNNFVKNTAFFISILSFSLNALLLIINFYMTLVGLITFGILLFIKRKK